MMELTICIATVFHRYHFVLQNPDKPVRSRTQFPTESSLTRGIA